MSLTMYVEPALRPALLGLDAPPHPAWTAPRPRRPAASAGPPPRALEHVDDRQVAHVGHRVDLGGGEEVRRHLREAPARLAHEGRVVVERQRRVVAALQQHRGGTPGRANSIFARTSSTVSVLRLRVAGLAVEPRELAIGDADVGVVRVRVDDERDDLLGNRLNRAPPPAPPARAAARRSGASALDTVETLAVENLVAQLLDRRAHAATLSQTRTTL